VIRWADPTDADAFLAVVALPGFAHKPHSGHTLGCVRARLEWRYGTTRGAWRTRYVAPPQGGFAPVAFDAWEATVVEDTLPDWEKWHVRHEVWTDGQTLAWFGRQGLGDRLDNWTSGMPILELARDSHKPTLLVATTLPAQTAHGRLAVLERCEDIVAHRLPPGDSEKSFHLLWA
jgi:hypothetical protein